MTPSVTASFTCSILGPRLRGALKYPKVLFEKCLTVARIIDPMSRAYPQCTHVQIDIRAQKVRMCVCINVCNVM